MNLIDSYLIWFIAGIVLILIEIFTLSFTLLFFGISSIIVGSLKLLGLNHLGFELALLILFSLIGIFGIRKKLIKRAQQQIYSQDTEAVVEISHDVLPGAKGVVQYQGSVWTCVNKTGALLKKGAQVKIGAIEGNKIIIK